ncbi:hypothetical protein C1I98_06005 [Spongiactinospora gelatinilytica]|uniref:Uncharacterized protein n=1 Tax=Spongiactinospora gelatinilytica TaxID=2666298 RepID=A0A2W2HDT0_9ACTN|nr:hypothetical protein [Spongiactinospora gelatinilytica]PZG53109.1 hypothetical protein C1I98_06005 [Spongiactinospora gelatinilytica]
MDPFMPAYQARTPSEKVITTAKQLVAALTDLGVRDVTLIVDYQRVLVPVCHGLVAVVQDDGIWWHSPRHLRPDVPFYVHRGTVAGAAEGLAADYALLNPGPPTLVEVRHAAAPL